MSKPSRVFFEQGIIAAAIEWARGRIGDDMLKGAVGSLLAAYPDAGHAGAYGQCPDLGNPWDPCPLECASGVCRVSGGADAWVACTWADVRKGDFVKPPGAGDEHAAEVTEIGPVLTWHVNDLAADTPEKQRAVQYRPNEHAGEYSVRNVTMGGVMRRMRPEASVLIRTTEAELRAIEALGGWASRV